LEISTKKQFLPEICYEVLIDFISQIPKKEIFVEHVFPSLQPIFSTDPSEFLPETLSLALAIRAQFDFEVFKHVSKSPQSLSSGEILQPSNLPKLIPLLHRSVVTLPQLNTVWPRAVASILTSPSANRLSEFWDLAVDGTSL
jgi:hypothetical protein